jgi:DNA-binding transcriptional LysR family regulator
MAFDLQQLMAFNAIVSAGSLGRAADALHVTQPALSRTVRRLEDQAGAPLFERHSKGMQLTDIGRALQPHALLLQRESEHAEEHIQAMLGLAKGTIRVGAVGSIACLVLPLAIGSVCTKWPNLQVRIIEGVWDRLADALVSREIDLALGVDTEDTDEIVAVSDCRWADTSYVVAGQHHPLREKSPLRLSDTLTERWAILPRGTGPFEHMKKVFARHQLALPNVVVETRSVTALKSLIGRSGFLGWMPAPMYDAERRAGLIDALDIPGASDERTLTAFRRRAGMLPGPATKLLEALRALTAT